MDCHLYNVIIISPYPKIDRNVEMIVISVLYNTGQGEIIPKDEGHNSLQYLTLTFGSGEIITLYM
jgi:hypothetical protein